jgi:hypothetical protein
MIRLGVVLSGLLLAACGVIDWPKPLPERAATASAWTKPGIDPATVESAYAACLDATNTATRSDFDIDQDISASRSNDLGHSEFAQTQTRQNQDTKRDRAQTVLSSCMEAKGFSPAR